MRERATQNATRSPDRLLWWVAGVYIAAGFAQALLPRQDRDVVAPPAWIPVAVLLFNWCKAHARAAGVDAPAGYAPLCGLLPPLGVPLYFLRMFGWRRGGAGVLKAAAFYIAIAAGGVAANMAGAFVQQPAAFSLALYWGLPTADGDLCSQGRGEAQIAACTRMIASGASLEDAGLASAYYNRANGRLHQGDFDAAIADYGRALALDPRHVNAHVNRALARASQGDFDRAIADDSRALQLDPRNALAYANRAALEFLRGDVDATLADCTRALELAPQPGDVYQRRGMALYLSGNAARAAPDLARAQEMTGDPYASLALYLARVRAGQDGARELAARTAALDRKAWPGPLVALYLGRGAPESPLAAARQGDAAAQQAQLCAARYYMAQWHLLRHETDRALSLLMNAASQCPTDALERGGAIAQLKELAAR